MSKTTVDHSVTEQVWMWRMGDKYWQGDVLNGAGDNVSMWGAIDTARFTKTQPQKHNSPEVQVVEVTITKSFDVKEVDVSDQPIESGEQGVITLDSMNIINPAEMNTSEPDSKEDEVLGGIPDDSDDWAGVDSVKVDHFGALAKADNGDYEGDGTEPDRSGAAVIPESPSNDVDSKTS